MFTTYGRHIRTMCGVSICLSEHLHIMNYFLFYLNYIQLYCIVGGATVRRIVLSFLNCSLCAYDKKPLNLLKLFLYSHKDALPLRVPKCHLSLSPGKNAGMEMSN